MLIVYSTEVGSGSSGRRKSDILCGGAECQHFLPAGGALLRTKALIPAPRPAGPPGWTRPRGIVPVSLGRRLPVRCPHGRSPVATPPPPIYPAHPFLV